MLFFCCCYCCCCLPFQVSLVAILLSLYYLFIWNPYTRPTGNLTRTFINSEILFIEKTNYFDVDVSGHPHVIGSAPNSPHLTHNVKVNLTEAKVMVPVAVESRPQPVRRPPSESDAHEPGPIDSEMLHEAHQPEHVLLPVGPAISMDLRVESINSSTTSPTTNVIRTQQSNHVRIETIANSNIISASPKASLLLVNVWPNWFI